MNMERRKKPLIGDLVNLGVQFHRFPGDTHGLVIAAEGIHLYVRLLAIPWDGHSGREYVRRDSVDVVSRARQ
jgi:hypothetical protein